MILDLHQRNSRDTQRNGGCSMKKQLLRSKGTRLSVVPRREMQKRNSDLDACMKRALVSQRIWRKHSSYTAALLTRGWAQGWSRSESVTSEELESQRISPKERTITKQQRSAASYRENFYGPSHSNLGMEWMRT